MAASIVFMVYGLIILLIDSYALYRPRLWVEFVERQFMYRRLRISAGVFFVLLGVLPIYFFMSSSLWQVYFLSVLSGLFIVLGTLILAFPSSIRSILLSLGGLDDKVLFWTFLGDAAFGLLLVLVGLMLFF